MNGTVKNIHDNENEKTKPNTKAMIVRRENRDCQYVQIIVDGGMTLEQVDTFVYLCYIIIESGSNDVAIRNHI